MPTPFPGATDRLLASIVECSDDAIVAKDLSGIILSWNRAAARMFGFTAAEAVGQSIRLIIPPDRHAEEDEVLRRIRAGAGVSHFETVRQRKDGSLVDISLTVSPIRDADGGIVGASKIARDITQTRRLARQLDAASRLKDEFLATLSHELRTPLNAIAGYARMLRADVLDPGRHARAVEIIERNAKILSTLVSDLLDVSRIISGKVRINPQRCDVARLVDEAIEAVQPAMDAKRLQLVRHVDPRSGRVWGDPERLRQVVWNLLSNAVKFTPAGGSIDVRLAPADADVEFVVSDTGVGISPEFLPHLFERFRQADATMTREFSGLGLGLSIVRDLVQLHGGTVQGTSAGRGTGATFRVRLPRIPAAGAEGVPEDVHARETRHLPLNGLRVLTAGDVADSLLLVADALELAGADVLTAQSADDTLRSARRNQPDVLIIDLDFAELDGYSLIRAIRSAPDPIRSVPAVGLTSGARSEDPTHTLLSGFQAVLPKPVEAGELVGTVVALARTSRGDVGDDASTGH